MKKIIPFKKDIIFKTNLSEITSISLEHTLHIESDSLITGEFIISGEYKMADTSINTEAFSFNLPFDINIDSKYIVDNVVVDIDDFYYEIINNNVLSVNIDVLVDKLEEKPLIEEKRIVVEDLPINEENVVNEELSYAEESVGIELDDLIERKEENKVKEETINPVKEDYKSDEGARSLFDSFDNSSETYTTYKIYMVKEGDSVEIILQKYGVSKEELEKYNDLKEIKIGDKIIIPSSVNAQI